MTDDSPEEMKSARGSREAALLKRSLDQMTDKRDQSAGWLAAAFAAFNAGALATSLSFADKLTHPVLVASLFACGLLMTFATGVAFMVALSIMWRKGNDLAELLEPEPHLRDHDAIIVAAGKVGEFSDHLRPAIMIGLAAFIFTIAGVMSFVAFCQLYNVANDARCFAIQRDMLSAKPRRSDGPDLFQALQCRAQGEGSVYAPPRKR